MSETTLRRAIAVCIAGGVIAVAFTLWGLLFFFAALVAYGQFVNTREERVANATQELLANTAVTPTTAPLDTASAQLDRLLNDAGLGGSHYG
jgi:1,4-dihydroxy-2-naphthoate octaprenyltransferase